MPSHAPSDANPFAITLTEVEGALPPHYAPAHRGGVLIADLDGDHDLDVVLARGTSARTDSPGGPSLLLRNEGAGDEVPRLVPDPGFERIVGAVDATGAAAGDYDADGDLDLFLTALGRDMLLRNDGGGSFSDVTAAAGVGGPANDRTNGALWADLNADGLLDLYVLQHAPLLPPPAEPAPEAGNRLYLNVGDGTFRDAAVEVGADNRGAAHAGLAADLDGDGALEIYVANDQYISGVGTPVKYPDAYLPPDAYLDPVIDDSGVLRFEDRAAEVGTDGPRDSMGVALADLDRDGFPDLYVADWGGNHLQLWDPEHRRYELVADDWNVARGQALSGHLLVSWNVRFMDLDHDGLEELFVVNGWETARLRECLSLSQLDLFLRRPRLEPSFVDASADVGLADPTALDCTAPAAENLLAGRGLAMGDLDGDGDDDVIMAGAAEPYRYYRNDTPLNDHGRLRIRLRGTVSSPYPAGATVEVLLTDGSRRRQFVYAGGDVASQGDPVFEIGLGQESVTQAWVHWPSGASSRIDTHPWFDLGVELSLTEPQWLSVVPRVVAAGDPDPTLTFRHVSGLPTGTLTVERSDGIPVELEERGDVITARLPRPRHADSTVLHLAIDGEPLRPRPVVVYR